jgi:hypothetical protein
MVSRQELYELVWSMPMTRAAKKYSVSGSYLARVCTVLRVPRPQRGYWAKLEVGKAPAQSALPEALPGDQLFWSKEGDASAPRVRAEIATTAPQQPRVRRSVTGIHSLIQGARRHYETGYKVEDGQLLRPYKRFLVDVTVSAAGLDKALSFANDLFNALESVGHRVCLAPSNEHFHRPNIDEHEEQQKSRRQEYPYNRPLWTPHRSTAVYVDTTPFGLAVVEMTESIVMRYANGRYIRESDYKQPKVHGGYVDHTWTTTNDLPCGRLRLVVYSLHRGVSWSMSFEETETRTLTQDITRIVKSIENSVEVLRKEITEADSRAELRRREQEAQHAQWLLEDDQRQIARSIKESREEMEQVIKSWAAVVSIEQFFKSAEERATSLPEERKVQLLKRLQLARGFVGTQDPLEFVSSWRTPNERYVPLALRKSPV